MSKIERYECPQNLENCKSCGLIQKETCRRNLDRILGTTPEIDLFKIRREIENVNSLLATKAA